MIKLSEVREYHKIWKSVGGDARYSELFKNKHRIYLDVELVEKNNKASTIQLLVTEVLTKNGYQVDDYLSGTAHKIDNVKNEMKIGKILQRIDGDLKNKFDSDPLRDASKISKSNLKVVISKHPLDIASMSTGRGWSSCMDIRNGQNRRYVKEDIREGTLVAYLIKDTDLDIKNPIGRILIKPFVQKRKVALVPEDKTYGTSGPGFRETINKWLSSIQNVGSGIFKLNKKLYYDGKSNIMSIAGISHGVRNIYGNNVIVYSTETKQSGIATINGDVILDCKYDSINGGAGGADTNGFIITKIIDDGRGFNKNSYGYASVKDGKISKFIDTIYDYITIVSDKYFIFKISDKLGISDYDNNVFIRDCINIKRFGASKELLMVSREPNKTEIYNVDLREVVYTLNVDINSIGIISYKHELISIKQANNSLRILSLNGEVIVEACGNMHLVKDNYFAVSKPTDKKKSNGLFLYTSGFSTSSGSSFALFNLDNKKHCTEFKYNTIQNFDNDLFRVSTIIVTPDDENKYIEYLIDVNGVEYCSEGGYQNIQFITCAGASGNTRTTTNVCILSTYDNPYSDDVTSVLFDTTSKKVISSKYDGCNNYLLSTNYVQIYKNNCVGLFDIKKFVEVAPPIFQKVEYYYAHSILKSKAGWGYIKDDKIIDGFKTKVLLKKHLKNEKASN